MTEEARKLQASVRWTCRIHPTEWFHEVGCPHMDWTPEQLLEALVSKKRFEDLRLLGKPFTIDVGMANGFEIAKLVNEQDRR